MKNLSLLILTYCLLNSAGAQETCVPNDQRLYTNALNTSVNPLYLWWDGNDSQFSYEADTSTQLLFAAGFWMSGLDESENFAFASTSYGAPSGLFDFQTGPFGTGGNFTNAAYFCRSFKVTKRQIRSHLLDLVDGNLDEPIPAIMDWPGRDNAIMPSTAFGIDLAPFVDVNGDNKYQPELGDYPDFRADEAVWWVTNDMANHLESGSLIPVGVEVQVLAQAYEGTGHPAAKAQLYSVKLVNKLDRPLDSLTLSLWVDPYPTNERSAEYGSIPSRNAMFVHRTDLTSPPILFLQSLPSTLNGAPSLERKGSISTRPRSGAQVVPTNVTRSGWADGIPLTEGGDGYGGTVPTNWIFSGNPADSLAWSTCRQDSLLFSPFLLNVTLLEKFNYLDVFETHYVVSVVDGDPVSCQDISSFLPTIDSTSDYVQNTVVSSNRNLRQSINKLSLKPNPARDVFEISLGVGQEALQSATLFDGLGRVVEDYSTNELNGTINVAHLPRGTYSLVARDTKGEVCRSRVVLQ